MSHIAIVSDGPRNRGENHDHPTGWRRYLYSTNHKDIGTMYLVFAICAGLIGGVFSIVIRMELQHPGLQIFTNTHTYNMFVTSHGLIMIFFTLMPAMVGGFGNLDGPAHDRRAGHGVPADEQRVVLAATVVVRVAHHFHVRGR